MELQGDGVTMNNNEVDKVTDAELEGIAGGAGKLSAHDLKKIEMMKRNAANEVDDADTKPKGK